MDSPYNERVKQLGVTLSGRLRHAREELASGMNEMSLWSTPDLGSAMEWWQRCWRAIRSRAKISMQARGPRGSRGYRSVDCCRARRDRLVCGLKVLEKETLSLVFPRWTRLTGHRLMGTQARQADGGGGHLEGIPTKVHS